MTGLEGSLSGERGRALHSLLPLLRRGLVDGGDTDEFLALYTRLWGGHGVSIGQRCGFGPWAKTYDVPRSWIEAHGTLVHQDPSEAFLTTSPEGTPFITSDIWTPASRRTEIYREFRRHGYADSMVQRFSAPHLGDLFSVMHRLDGMPPFSAEEQTLARLLHTHVAAGLATWSAVRAFSLPGAKAASARAVVSFPGMSVHVDDASRRAWTRLLGQPLGARGFTRVKRMIARIVLDVFHGVPGARSRRILPRVIAETAWVPPRPNESHRALVLFFEDASSTLVLAAPAAELLSPMQRRVVELAARGERNLAIASALDLSVETVRTYLREGMNRLAVERRVELASLLEPVRTVPR